jgi:hypothetical protein
LPEALARVRHDAILVGSRRGDNKARGSWALPWLRSVAPSRARGYAVAALVAVMTGIVVNALTLQHERHPSPFFATGATSKSNAAKPAPDVAAVPAVVTVSPPVRPFDLGVVSESEPSPRAGDPIGDVLRGGGNKETQRLIVAAQTALVKLGYSVKIGPSLGADASAALRDFEKTHGLPISTDITPHLVKLLSAAASASASR